MDKKKTKYIYTSPMMIYKIAPSAGNCHYLKSLDSTSWNN